MQAKVKDAILKTAGYPESGSIAELADAMAEAVVNIDKPEPVREVKKFEVEKETRTIQGGAEIQFQGTTLELLRISVVCFCLAAAALIKFTASL